MTPLPAFSPANISLSWSGSDALSGISTYDVQVRAGLAGAWTDVLSNTTEISTNYIGVNGITYYFRTRASDIAGNVEDSHPDYDTFTIVDTEAPTGTLMINGGALTTTSINTTLSLSATDVTSGVAMMSFSNDGSIWTDWRIYSLLSGWTTDGGDGVKIVYARIRDTAGNISNVISDSIGLDTTIGTDYSLSINNGATFTNQTGVVLNIGAEPHTSDMLLSNDGGFSGAIWESYASQKSWIITQYGNYVIPRVVYIRYRDVIGNISSVYQDDIILDVNPPTGSVNVLPNLRTVTLLAVEERAFDTNPLPNGNSFCIYLPIVMKNYCIVETDPANVILQLYAQDDVSGVGFMMISNKPTFNCAEWEFYETSKSWYMPDGATTVYVKYRDNAGNISPVILGTRTP